MFSLHPPSPCYLYFYSVKFYFFPHEYTYFVLLWAADSIFVVCYYYLLGLSCLILLAFIYFFVSLIIFVTIYCGFIVELSFDYDVGGCLNSPSVYTHLPDISIVFPTNSFTHNLFQVLV